LKKLFIFYLFFPRVGMETCEFSTTESLVATLDEVYEAAQWQTMVSTTLKDLEKRIVKLEESNLGHTRGQQPARRPSSADRRVSFTASGTYGFEGIPTCIHLIMNNRVASVQCLWLIICFVCYLSIGVSQFIRAKTNEDSQ